MSGLSWIVPGKVAACSREWIEAQADLRMWGLVVSFRDAGSPLPAMPPHARRVDAECDDVPDGRHAFTEAQAEEIAAWVHVYTGVQSLLCQCEYGRSRSVAAALSVADYFGLSPVAVPVGCEPNERVYRLMRDALTREGR